MVSKAATYTKTSTTTAKNSPDPDHSASDRAGTTPAQAAALTLPWLTLPVPRVTARYSDANAGAASGVPGAVAREPCRHHT